MADQNAISNHWGRGDVLTRIIQAMEAAEIAPDAATVEQLAPVDHFHACGFAATIELGDSLPIEADHLLLDIGCGIGGPARYLAKRFGCRVKGIDITEPFVEAANELTALVKLEDRVSVEQGDGHRLPFEDGTFDGAYSQHVTMNVEDRAQFFREAFRVLKSGGYFAITEHGLGPKGEPHHPVPWSEDGSGAFLCTPSETVDLLEAAGFSDIDVEDTGAQYLGGYKQAMELAARGELPIFGVHILLGESAPAKIKNAARNIEEQRTHPIRVLCGKPS